MTLKPLLRDVKKVLRFDVALFHHRTRLLLACLGVTLVPAAYSVIYLSSAWDPYAHLEQLPVALVNLDQGTRSHGREVQVGQSIVEGLEAKHTFRFTHLADEATARQQVEAGALAFAVIIPPELSRTAMAATAPAKVRVVFSEGNNFMTSGIAKRFAGELAHSTNEALNAQRWGVVLDTVDTSRASLEKLKAGVTQLRDGAAQLDEGLAKAHDGSTALAAGAERARDGAAKLEAGSRQVAEGTVALTKGVSKLGGGLQTMKAKLPADEQLASLAGGAKQVADGQARLTVGLSRLAEGTQQAQAGARQLEDGTAGIPLVGARIAAGAGKLETGLGQLSAGAVQARDGSAQLADGSAKVADGTAKLTSGMQQLGAGLRTMADKVPDDATLNRLGDGATAVAAGNASLHAGLGTLATGTHALDDGLERLGDGAGRLHGGLEVVTNALPSGVDGLEGDAKGLAASVEPELEALNAVGAYGNSMTPYFLGLSLWVGVVMMGFIFQLRWFPQRVRHVKKAALVLGRLVIPSLLVTAQATLLTLALRFVLHASIPSLLSLWLVAVTTSLVFLTVLLMLVGLLGDVGKVVALLLLVFQMGASGGVFPTWLTSPLYRAVSPWLPFTWVVRAGRAVMFHAFEGAWLQSLGVVALFGVAAVTVTSLLGRWKFVARHRFVPLLDV